MSNEMKLITALCEALGFKVETDLDFKYRKESQIAAMEHNQGFNPTDRLLVTEAGPTMRLYIDDDGLYQSRLRDPIVSYRLVKADPQSDQ